MNLEIREVEETNNKIPRKINKTNICPICNGENKSEAYNLIRIQTFNMVNNLNSNSESSEETKSRIKKYVENVYDSNKNSEAAHKIIINIGEHLNLPKGWETCQHCKGSLTDPNFKRDYVCKKGLQIWYVKKDKGFILFEGAISDIFTDIKELKKWYLDKFSKWAPDIFNIIH